MTTRSARRMDAVLGEMGSFFMKDSPLHAAARAIAARMDDAQIPYAIADAMCLAAHGVVRATEDIDLLIAKEDLARFKNSGSVAATRT